MTRKRKIVENQRYQIWDFLAFLWSESRILSAGCLVRRLCGVRIQIKAVRWCSYPGKANVWTRCLGSLCPGYCCHGAWPLIYVHLFYLWLETVLLKLFGWFMLKILMSVSWRKLSPAHVEAGNWVNRSQSRWWPWQCVCCSIRCWWPELYLKPWYENMGNSHVTKGAWIGLVG